MLQLQNSHFSGLVDGIRPTMTLFGTLVSWTYLRFYQFHSNGTRGDMGDNFNFAKLVPFSDSFY